MCCKTFWMGLISGVATLLGYTDQGEQEYYLLFEARAEAGEEGVDALADHDEGEDQTVNECYRYYRCS